MTFVQKTSDNKIEMTKEEMKYKIEALENLN